MAYTCKNCSGPLRGSDFNVGTDVALCPSCGHIGRLSDLVKRRDAPRAHTILHPPPGAFRRDSFKGPVFGATTRSPIAFFLVPFMLVWTGGALGGIYGTQILKGEFNLFLSLFGVPFLLAALLFWGITLMAIAGRVEVRVHPDGRGEVFTGVGRWGRTKPFDLAAVEAINEETSLIRNRRNHQGLQRQIVLTGRSRLAFGRGLSDDRRHFVLQSLRALHSGTRD